MVALIPVSHRNAAATGATLLKRHGRIITLPWLRGRKDKYEDRFSRFERIVSTSGSESRELQELIGALKVDHDAEAGRLSALQTEHDKLVERVAALRADHNQISMLTLAQRGIHISRDLALEKKYHKDITDEVFWSIVPQVWEYSELPTEILFNLYSASRYIAEAGIAGKIRGMRRPPWRLDHDDGTRLASR
jgi:hypothetical protein